MDLKSVVLPVHVENELSLLIESELVSLGWWVHLVGEVSVAVSAHESVLGWSSLWNKYEWSIDMESELLVDALGWLFAGLIKINNSPLLVESLVWRVDNNVLAFLILAAINIESFLVYYVGELASAGSVSEDLEPVVLLEVSSLKVLSSTI